VTTAEQRNQYQLNDPPFSNDDLFDIIDNTCSNTLNLFHRYLNSDDYLSDAKAVYHDHAAREGCGNWFELSGNRGRERVRAGTLLVMRIP
jgi:hypothetical protein